MARIISISKNGESIEVTAKALSTIRYRSHQKQEYHGNGKNAWYGDDYVITTEDGQTITVNKISVRHSYRWHKTQNRINGYVPRSKQDYAILDSLTI